jgi:sulfotransferase family protein
MKAKSVHVLSPSPRCGTTLLAFVLVRSGCCHFPPQDRIQAEDFFLKHAHLLAEYCDKTSKEWRWFIDDEKEIERRKQLLLRELGEGLLHFASPNSNDNQAPFVLKTPHSDNLDLLTLLFPQSQFLFIIRDGRDAAESAARAFQWQPHEYWMSLWAQGVRRLLRFIEKGNETSPGWKLIRYEELIMEQSPVLADVFDFLGWNSNFTWRDLQSLPVYGSSSSALGEGPFKWEIRPKPENFNPVGRWQLWNEDRKRAFKEIAGEELVRLEYVNDDRW